MALSKFNGGGGDFFKAGQHTDKDVILFEPTRIERQVPSNYGPQDIVHAAVTTFDGDAHESLGSVKITGRALVADLESYLKEQVAARIVLVPNKKGGKDFPALRPAAPEAEARVEAYLEKRDAALADAPDFLN